MRRLGMSYTESRNLPITFRQWFISRYVREHEEIHSARDRAAGQANANLDKAQTIARAFGR